MPKTILFWCKTNAAACKHVIKKNMMAAQNLCTLLKDLYQKNAQATVNIVWVGVDKVIEIFLDKKEYNKSETYYQRYMAITSIFSALKLFSGAKSILKQKMQTEKTFAMSKTARYRIWEPARAADNDNIEMLDALKIIKKPKREK